MRLIDADWVIEHTKPYELSDEDWSVTGGTAIRLIHNVIDNAPTIDAVPVVRCKDCYYGSYDSELNDAMICTSTNDGYWRHGDDFCSYGRKKNVD